jgi:AraC-like DNA-binding protein
LEFGFRPFPPLPSVTLADAAGFCFPAPSERAFLERLTSFDLEGARLPFEEIARSLGNVPPPELKIASLYAFELLCNVNRLVWRGAAEEGRRLENRAILIEVFSRLASAAELRSSFEERYWLIVAPFRGGSEGQHPAVCRAKAFIHESYQRKISLREVAAHLGLSRTYLSTLFRRECGITLTEYLHRVRLRRAQGLMHSGLPALSKVAALVGYQNYRDFHRNFVRYQNASPKNFRRDLKRCVDQ